jgi:hypothetical protein
MSKSKKPIPKTKTIPKVKVKNRSLLSPEAAKQIENLVKAGNFFDTACVLAGISPKNGKRYLDWGREIEGRFSEDEEQEEIEIRAAEEKYLNFYRTVRKAQAYAEAHTMYILAQVGEGRPIIEKIKRKMPDEKGRMVEVEDEVLLKPDPKTLQWHVERRFRKHWGVPHQEIDLALHGIDDEPIRIDSSGTLAIIDKLGPGDLTALCEIARRSGIRGGSDEASGDN